MTRFKKILNNFIDTILEVLPNDIEENQVDIWFKDETRGGRHIIQQWAEKGVSWAIRQQQFEYSCIFGAVCPAIDMSISLVLPVVNKGVIKLHFEAISGQVPTERHEVMIVDASCNA